MCVCVCVCVCVCGKACTARPGLGCLNLTTNPHPPAQAAVPKFMALRLYAASGTVLIPGGAVTQVRGRKGLLRGPSGTYTSCPVALMSVISYRHGEHSPLPRLHVAGAAHQQQRAWQQAAGHAAASVVDAAWTAHCAAGRVHGLPSGLVTAGAMVEDAIGRQGM